jgi:hypothetical protein
MRHGRPINLQKLSISELESLRLEIKEDLKETSDNISLAKNVAHKSDWLVRAQKASTILYRNLFVVKKAIEIRKTIIGPTKDVALQSRAGEAHG